MAPRLQFLGAAGTVTGSKFLLYAAGKEVLFDAGLFQGKKELRKRNWDPMPINPKKIDAVVLTHGHIDHCGYLPRLVQQGFNGPVYCTAATGALLEIMLPDSAHIQEEEAKYANKKGYSKHNPALPLYTGADATEALERIKTFDYGESFSAQPGIEVRFHPSGHILGSAFAEVDAEGRKIVFSGDLGGYDDAIMKPPRPMPKDVDYILAESTYGGRNQENRPIDEQMQEYLRPVLDKNGVVVIPAFAVGRTTLVLYHLRVMMESGQIPTVPVFVDSPMASNASALYCDFGSEHNLRVDLLEDAEMCPIQTSEIHYVRKVEDSKALNQFKGPGIIISASGMATGGRVVHHLKRRLPHRENLILLVGYQAHGTRGRRLLEGAEELRMFGEDIPVRAKVASVRGLSAHGDSDEVVRWLGTAQSPPKKVFVVHGEEKSLEAMAERIENELGFPHHTPDYMETVNL